MTALQGLGVIVTRPEQQSTPLCRLLEAEGAHALRLPVIEIRGVVREDARDLRGELARFDLIIFTSVNAVRFGASLLEQRRDLNLAAIGPATARALNQAGYRVAVQPTAGFDSEGLLAHPKLLHLAGHRVLLVKGRGGRHLLEQEIGARGGQVQTLEVYERVAAAPAPALLEAVQAAVAAGTAQVITATSVDIGAGLLAFASPALRAAFERITWLVPAERVALELRARGLQAAILIADSAEDSDLVAALRAWRSGA